MPSPGETIPNSVGYHFFDGFPRLAASQSDYFSSETVRGLARLVRLSLHHPSAALTIVAGQGPAWLIQPEGASGYRRAVPDTGRRLGAGLARTGAGVAQGGSERAR